MLTNKSWLLSSVTVLTALSVNAVVHADTTSSQVGGGDDALY